MKWYVYYEGNTEHSALARFIDVLRYSLSLYDGHILVKGGEVRQMFGAPNPRGFRLLVEFPQRASAEAWYQSALFGLILEKATVWPDGELTMLAGAA